MQKSKFNAKRKNELIFYVCLLAIPLLQFTIFYIYVNINSILLAFRQYDVLEGFSFVGLDNFKEVFRNISEDSIFRGSFGNTFLILGLGLLIGSTLPVVVSFYIYKKKFLSGFFRVVLFLPNIISTLVIVLAYKYFLEVAIPEIWSVFFGEKISGLLTNPNTDFLSVLFYNYWFGMGSGFLLYASTMSGISDSVVESAELDGFTPLQEFFYITLPLIFPTFVTFVVVNISTLFTNQINLFSIYSLYAPDSMMTVGYFLYRETTRATLTGYPYLATLGILCTLVAVPLSLGLKYCLEKFGPSVE